MPFVIFDSERKEYVDWKQQNVRYVPSPNLAKSFHNQAKAQSFINSQIVRYCKIKNLWPNRFQIANLADAECKDPDIGRQGVFIMDPKKGLYLAISGTSIQWISDMMKAKMHKNITKAQEFVQLNKEKIAATNIDIGDLCLVSGKTHAIVAPVVIHTNEGVDTAKGKNGIEEASCSIERGFESEVAHTKDSNLMSIPASPFDFGLSEKELEAVLSQIPHAIAPFITLFGRVDRAINCCTQMLKQTDLETSDLLHKAEFINANAVNGYKIYKEIHDCRVHRRNIKDMIKLLDIIRMTDVVDTVHRFGQMYGAYKHELENRSYQVRVRNDLF